MVGSGFLDFGGGKLKLTRQGRFSSGEGLLLTVGVVGSADVGVVGSADVGLDLIGFFGGLGLWMGLDNPTSAHGPPKNNNKNPFFPLKNKKSLIFFLKNLTYSLCLTVTVCV